MFDNEYYIRVKRAHESTLFKLPGVRGIGLGPKFIKGRATGELAIQVFVEAKRPVADLKPGEIIPSFIRNIPTDVLLSPAIINSAAPVSVGQCKTGNIDVVLPKTAGTLITDLVITTVAHGLYNEAWVRLTGKVAEPGIAYQVTVVTDNTFSIHVMQGSNSVPPIDTPYTAGTAGWVLISNVDTLCCCPSGEITTISSSTEVVITSNAHGLQTGDPVKIRKTGPKAEPAIYRIKKVNDNDFILKGADPAQFSFNPGGWRWYKVSIAPTGIITRIENTHPVVIHSKAHGLKAKDSIVMTTMDNIPVTRLTDSFPLANLINKKIGPFELDSVTPDTFKLKDINATGWTVPNPEPDIYGSWIKVAEDMKKYDRIWGGMHIEMQESETTTVERPPEDRSASPLTTKSRPNTPVKIHYEQKLSTGTLGCIVTDKKTGKRAMLSNKHVLYSGGNKEVHHPDYYVSSKTCSSHKIGKVIRGFIRDEETTYHYTIDAAIAGFEDKVKTDRRILDIGYVQGTATITADDIKNHDYRVWKRGAMSQITEGVVLSVDYTFRDETVTTFEWKNQLLVDSMYGRYRGIMNIQGDSGSVLVNKDNKVVGLVFKVNAAGQAIANHIHEVELALDISVMDSSDPPPPVADNDAAASAQTVSVGIPRLFSNAMAELTETEAGQHMVGLLQEHYPGVITLLNSNKKFAVAWHRNHGPELLKNLRETIEARTIPVPPVIQGKPFTEWVSDIFTALRAFGSAKLVADLEKYERQFMQLLTLSYEDILDSLRSNSIFQQPIKTFS